MTMTNNEMENAIAAKIATDALAAGYTISVYDGGEWVVRRSSDFKVIIDSLASTDSDKLKFRNADGEIIGVVVLIWGNCGWELINDYTASDAMEALLKGANELGEKFEETYN